MTTEKRLNRTILTMIMRSSRQLTMALLVFTLLSSWALCQAENPARKGFDIGAAAVDLDASHLVFPHAMRVFIDTGSSSNCLVTLREANNPFNVRPVFCGPRTFQGKRGILLGVYFFDPAGSDVVIGLTVYQQGAISYGSPVLYQGD